MLIGELRSQIDRIWDFFWAGGNLNRLAVIEHDPPIVPPAAGRPSRPEGEPVDAAEDFIGLTGVSVVERHVRHAARALPLVGAQAHGAVLSVSHVLR